MEKIYVCRFCGSPRVTQEALLDVNTPNRPAHALYDKYYCPDCEDEGGEGMLLKVTPPEGFDMRTGFITPEADRRRRLILGLARDLMADFGDDVEIDDDARVNEGEDNGAFVQSWVWVRFEGTPFNKEPKE